MKFILQQAENGWIIEFYASSTADAPLGIVLAMDIDEALDAIKNATDDNLNTGFEQN